MFGLRLVKDKDFNELKEIMTDYKRTLEDVGWINLNMEDQLGRDTLGDSLSKIIKRSRIYYYRNPLAGHWVHLTTWFTFGEGVSVPKAKDENIQKIVEKFWEDEDNQLSLTSFQAQQKICNKLQYEGNLYFVLFINEAGDVRVRILNATDVEDVILFEEDNLRPAFYKVGVHERKYNFVADSYDLSSKKIQYYPAYSLSAKSVLDYNIPGSKMAQDAVIFHVKDNSDINDKQGVPALYRGIDWMKAHKDTVADVATLVKSLSQLAWKKKVKGSAAQVNAIKNALHAKTDLTNFRASTGSTQIENEGVDTTAINTPTGGAVIGEKAAKQEQLMVSAASGLMYHYFGDPSTGNLATAKSMELPMVKKFSTNQRLWEGIINTILQFAINKKIEAGLLAGSVSFNANTQRDVYKTNVDRHIDIDFPPILEKDLKVEAEALEIAVRNDLMSVDTAARTFLLAANQNNIDEEIEKIKSPDNIKPVQLPQFGMLPGDNNPGDKNLGNKKIKESLDNPKKETDPGIRLAKKNNHVLQRMNGYRKALAGNYRQLQVDVREALRVSGKEGMIVGNVENLEKILKRFETKMKESARVYFPIAIDIGEKYLQSHLKESRIKESLYEQNGQREILLQEVLGWNDEFLESGLITSIDASILEGLRRSYDTEADFRRAINAAVQKYESRMELYVGAFWTVEESAVKEAGRGQGIMCNFVGADDDSTCEGCRAELETNPHLLDEVEVPGTHECLGRCRHAIQIIEGSRQERI